MKEITIYQFQLEAIYEALRVAANTLNSRDKKTCLDRMITQAEQFARNALDGKKDERVKY